MMKWKRKKTKDLNAYVFLSADRSQELRFQF